MSETRPTARVEDAALVPDGGPARLALSGMPRAEEIAERVAAARGVWTWVGDRLVVTAVPSRLIDAAGRVGGGELADLLRSIVDPAVDAWLGQPPDLATPAGTLPTGSRPVVMGVCNVTPDSFFDGGVGYDPDDHPATAIAAARALVTAGADLVDVGGESTRPGAEPVSTDEELARVVPVVEALAGDGVVVSIDTTKATVARAAIEAGAALVNDVSAGARDEALLSTVADAEVPYVLMHMRGTPATMQGEADYDDVTGEVFDFLAGRLDRLAGLGVGPERVVIDPGIGFAKTPEHNLTLLRRARELTSLGRPLLIGASRKSFLTGFGVASGAGRDGSEADARHGGPREDARHGGPREDTRHGGPREDTRHGGPREDTRHGGPREDTRLEPSLAMATLAVAAGARLVRVHDVAETVRTVAAAHAVATAPG